MGIGRWAAAARFAAIVLVRDWIGMLKKVADVVTWPCWAGRFAIGPVERGLAGAVMRIDCWACWTQAGAGAGGIGWRYRVLWLRLRRGMAA